MIHLGAGSESRFQCWRSLFVLQILGRCPRLTMRLRHWRDGHRGAAPRPTVNQARHGTSRSGWRTGRLRIHPFAADTAASTARVVALVLNLRKDKFYKICKNVLTRFPAFCQKEQLPTCIATPDRFPQFQPDCFPQLQNHEGQNNEKTKEPLHYSASSSKCVYLAFNARPVRDPIRAGAAKQRQAKRAIPRNATRVPDH